jgi:hypothetical protein
MRHRPPGPTAGAAMENRCSSRPANYPRTPGGAARPVQCSIPSRVAVWPIEQSIRQQKGVATIGSAAHGCVDQRSGGGGFSLMGLGHRLILADRFRLKEIRNSESAT